MSGEKLPPSSGEPIQGDNPTVPPPLPAWPEGYDPSTWQPRRPIPESDDWIAEIQKREGLSDIIKAQSETKVGDYVRTLTENAGERRQSQDDVLNSIGSYAHALLGQEVADEAERSARETRTLLTTNHVSHNMWDIQVAATLAASLDTPYKTTLALAGGFVPLDAASSARGGIWFARDRVVGYKKKTRRISSS